MAKDQSVETQKLAMTTTDAIANFEGGCQAFYLSADADCYVDFDVPTDTGSFLVKANIAYPKFDFRGGNIQNVHARTVSSTGNLYILGVRN